MNLKSIGYGYPGYGGGVVGGGYGPYPAMGYPAPIMG